jgi:tryptophan-rich sensory protein
VAAFMVITCCALQAVTSGFSTAQTQALAFAFIDVNGAAFQLDLVFFGLWCILAGYLLWRSALLPRLSEPC